MDFNEQYTSIQSSIGLQYERQLINVYLDLIDCMVCGDVSQACSAFIALLLPVVHL